MPKIVLVEDFGPLKINIIQFPDGFRLKSYLIFIYFKR